MGKKGRPRLWLAVVTGLAVAFSLVPVATAASANISHSYHSTGPLVNGDIASLDPKRSDYVEAANTDNSARLIGVAVAANDSLLAVNDTSGLVQVATSGTVNTLVTTINGNVNVGDQIAISPFNGLGMKAATGSKVVGLAQSSLSTTSSGATQETVKDKSGHSHQITVGYVNLALAITANSANTSGVQLNSLQKAVYSLTGKTIPTIRLVISLVVAILALSTLLVLVYAAIYGSIISVGRNPLAKHVVYRNLAGVVGMIVLIAGVASVIIFFLLR